MIAGRAHEAKSSDGARHGGRFMNAGRGKAGDEGCTLFVPALERACRDADAPGQFGRDSPMEVLEAVGPLVASAQHGRRASLQVAFAVALDGPEIVGRDHATRPSWVHAEHDDQPEAPRVVLAQ
jgi:hypothetical protein